MDRKSTFHWTRIIGVVALLWYAFGTLQFWLASTMTPDTVEAMVSDGTLTRDYADFYFALPGWTFVAFGGATIFGVIASVFMILDRAQAAMIFGLSLLCAIAMYGYYYILSGNASVIPTADTILTIVILVITAALTFLCARFVGKT